MSSCGLQPQRLSRRQLHANKRHLRPKRKRLGYLFDRCQTTLRYIVELRCTSGSEFSVDVMFHTDFGESAALQLRHVIRTDDIGRADVHGVSQLLLVFHEVFFRHPCRIIACHCHSFVARPVVVHLVGARR